MPKLLWRSSASSLVLLWVLIAIFTLILGIVFFAQAFADDQREGGLLPAVLILLVAFVAGAWSTRATVEVDEEEFRVRFGPGWPTKRIPWSRVRSVAACRVRPSEYGGWGYKVLVGKRTQALVLRAGDGLRLTLDNGRIFVVSVDHARQGLEAIRRINRDGR